VGKDLLSPEAAVTQAPSVRQDSALIKGNLNLKRKKFEAGETRGREEIEAKVECTEAR
jgi:hypothetical protein